MFLFLGKITQFVIALLANYKYYLIQLGNIFKSIFVESFIWYLSHTVLIKIIMEVNLVRNLVKVSCVIILSCITVLLRFHVQYSKDGKTLKNSHTFLQRSPSLPLFEQLYYWFLYYTFPTICYNNKTYTRENIAVSTYIWDLLCKNFVLIICNFTRQKSYLSLSNIFVLSDVVLRCVSILIINNISHRSSFVESLGCSCFSIWWFC